MDDIFQWIIKGAAALFAAALARIYFLIDGLRTEIATLKESHSNHRLHVSENYVTKGEFHDRMNHLDQKVDAGFTKVYDKLDTINEKLTGKQDKS